MCELVGSKQYVNKLNLSANHLFWRCEDRQMSGKTINVLGIFYIDQGFVLLNFYCNKNAIIANIQ